MLNEKCSKHKIKTLILLDKLSFIFDLINMHCRHMIYQKPFEFPPGGALTRMQLLLGSVTTSKERFKKFNN